MGAQSSHKVQLVDREGRYNQPGVERFFETATVSKCGLSYAVVAIMGPQSSGKSTLLNHLFGTTFSEMDATRGRSQTTQGIWLSQAADISPCTLVCDLEGADSYQRGEEDTAFEKKSSLFALAVADVVLINMWCHDIGRREAASWPLLKLVFQAMMLFFTEEKTTLLFVIRDKTNTSLAKLADVLNAGVQKIWETVVKPERHENKPLSDFFNVKVIALSHFEYRNPEFYAEVHKLRELFQESISPGGIAGNKKKVVSGGAFATHAQGIWNVIKDNVSDPQALQANVAELKCGELVRKILEETLQSAALLELTTAANVGIVTRFGSQVDILLNDCISRYDNEAAMFNEGVRNQEREKLLSKVGEELHGAYLTTLNHHMAAAKKRFSDSVLSTLNGDYIQMVSCLTKTQLMSIFEKSVKKAMSQFDKDAEDAKCSKVPWDASEIRKNLKTAIDDMMKQIQPALFSYWRHKQGKFALGAFTMVVSNILVGFAMVGLIMV